MKYFLKIINSKLFLRIIVKIFLGSLIIFLGMTNLKQTSCAITKTEEDISKIAIIAGILLIASIFSKEKK